MTKEEKVKKFLEEYKDLTKRHNVDFVTFPQFVPSGGGDFKIVCQTVPVDLAEMKKDDKFVETGK